MKQIKLRNERRYYEALLIDCSAVVDIIMGSIINQLVLGGQKMDATLLAELKAIRVAIAKQEPIVPSAGLPNGTHNCMPDSITIGKAGKAKDGRLQITIAWKAVDGDAKDSVQFDYNGLDEQSMGYTKGKLLTMISDLPKDILLWQDVFDNFCQNNTDVFEVNVTTNEKGYKNTYLRGLASGVAEEAVEELEEATESLDEEGMGDLEEDIFEETPTPKPKVDTKATAKAVAKPAQKTVARR